MRRISTDLSLLAPPPWSSHDVSDLGDKIRAGKRAPATSDDDGTCGASDRRCSHDDGGRATEPETRARRALAQTEGVGGEERKRTGGRGLRRSKSERMKGKKDRETIGKGSRTLKRGI